jgi:hypothetical protein
LPRRLWLKAAEDDAAEPGFTCGGGFDGDHDEYIRELSVNEGQTARAAAGAAASAINGAPGDNVVQLNPPPTGSIRDVHSSELGDTFRMMYRLNVTIPITYIYTYLVYAKCTGLVS